MKALFAQKLEALDHISNIITSSSSSVIADFAREKRELK
jgi:hypothetical protein